MSRQIPKNEIRLEDYMDIIKRHARVGYIYLRHPAVDSVEDLEQEGVVVFQKVLNNCYDENGPATFKSLLTRSLRNHMQTLMRKSFHQLMSCDIKTQEYDINHPMRRYAEQRSRAMSSVGQSLGELDIDYDIEQRDDITNILGKLTAKERQYVNLVMAGEEKCRNHGRKHARLVMRISKIAERKLRKQIQEKCKGVYE